MRIECTKAYAIGVLTSANTNRKVYRRKLHNHNSRWVEVTSVNQISHGYEYTVSALVDTTVASKMLALNAEIKQKQEELNSLKAAFITDATAYRSKRPRNTYKLSLGDNTVSVTQSNTAQVFAANTLKNKLGNAFEDIFLPKPAAYEIVANIKDAVVAALNGDIITCPAKEYLTNLTEDVDALTALMRPSIKANAYTFMEQIGVDWDTAMEWAADYQSCRYYELLSMIAEANNKTYDGLVQDLATAIEVTTTNRVNITNKE